MRDIKNKQSKDPHPLPPLVHTYLILEFSRPLTSKERNLRIIFPKWHYCIAQGASTTSYSGQRGDLIRTGKAEPDRSTEPILLTCYAVVIPWDVPRPCLSHWLRLAKHNDSDTFLLLDSLWYINKYLYKYYSNYP